MYTDLHGNQTPHRHAVELSPMSPKCPLWFVYDNRMQLELFHWHGEEAEERCRLVCDALNSREWST